jgi:hypothetical protein
LKGRRGREKLRERIKKFKRINLKNFQKKNCTHVVLVILGHLVAQNPAGFSDGQIFPLLSDINV